MTVTAVVLGYEQISVGIATNPIGTICRTVLVCGYVARQLGPRVNNMESEDADKLGGFQVRTNEQR